MAETKNKEKSKSLLREWLEQLQQESWQLELLISGLALYGVIEAKSLILDLEHYNFEYAWGVSEDLTGHISTALSAAWKLFFINLLIHIILRGLWIGAIGLRYVSSDIDYDELNYSKIFDQFLKRKIGNYDDFIEKLEMACSIIFAFTFLIVLLFLSGAVFVTSMSLIFLLLELFIKGQTVMMIIMTFYLIAFIVFIDFITLGSFKKIKEPTISKIYFYLFRFINLFTLAFLYRPLLYNFIDHRYTKRLFIAFIPYSIVITGGMSFFSNNSAPYIGSNRELTAEGFQIDHSWYEDLMEERLKQLEGYARKEERNLINHTILSQFYMDEDYPSIFFKYYKSDQLLYEQDSTLAPLWKAGMTFSWFEDERNESPIEKEIKENAEKNSKVLKKSILETKRELNKAKRQKKIQRMDSLKLVLDEINSNNDSIQKTKTDKLQEYRRKVYQDVIDLRLKHLKIYIDDMPYNDSLVCHYHNHPHKKEEGLLCHFSSKSLSEGHHDLKVHRDFIYREGREISTQKFIIPFIKIK